MFAEFTLGDAFLSVLWFCGLFLWIALAVTVFFDIFRSRDLSGWAKAAWVVLIIILPLLGVLIYLIARGAKMHERSEQQARDSEDAFRQYIRSAAQSSPSSDLEKLDDLRQRGIITDEEFARAKAKALA